MTNGVNPPGRDPDDWFTEPAPRRTAREAGTPLAVETARPTPPKDWLADDVEEHGRSWRDRISVAMREWRALILLLGGALVLVIGLLVAGVFSGSRTHPSSASVASTTTTRKSARTPRATPRRTPTSATMRMSRSARTSDQCVWPDAPMTACQVDRSNSIPCSRYTSATESNADDSVSRMSPSKSNTRASGGSTSIAEVSRPSAPRVKPIAGRSAPVMNLPALPSPEFTKGKPCHHSAAGSRSPRSPPPLR